MMPDWRFQLQQALPNYQFQPAQPVAPPQPMPAAPTPAVVAPQPHPGLLGGQQQQLLPWLQQLQNSNMDPRLLHYIMQKQGGFMTGPNNAGGAQMQGGALGGGMRGSGGQAVQGGLY